MKELLKTIIFSRFFIICISFIIGFLSAHFWYQDNPIEEISEKIIEEQTGINVDLTPKTPESSK
jgi:hypothetical protein